MVLFFHKKKSVPVPNQEYVPVDLVQRIAAQGYSEPQIISQLRQRGFSPSQIDKALSQSIKSAIERPQHYQQPPQVHQPIQTHYPPAGEFRPVSEFHRTASEPPEKIMPGPQSISAAEPRNFSSPEDFTLEPSEGRNEFTFEETPQEFLETQKTPEPSGPEITLEEIIEGIVAEKWHELEDRIRSFEKREAQIESEISDLRKEITNIVNTSKSSEQNVIGKLDDFGEHVSGIEGRIGSIEKVFKDFVPELTENVRTMSDIVEKMKDKK